jgi:hypothetical protein
LTLVLEEFLEQEVTTKLARPKRSPRQVSAQTRPIDWQCAHCACNDANQFTRDGHYRPRWRQAGGIWTVSKCPCWNVNEALTTLWPTSPSREKYQRFWLDAGHRAIFGTGLCRSLRQLSQEWGANLASSVGLRTINERINQLEARLSQVHREPISEVPAGVQFDGIWLSLQTQQDGIKEDSRKRKRHHKRGKRMVVLVALGPVDRWEWQTTNPGLGGSRPRRQGRLGTAGAALMGPWCEVGNGPASHRAGWDGRVGASLGLRLWLEPAKAALHLSQVAQWKSTNALG